MGAQFAYFTSTEHTEKYANCLGTHVEYLEKYADCVGVFYSHGKHEKYARNTREIREHECRVKLPKRLQRNGRTHGIQS